MNKVEISDIQLIPARFQDGLLFFASFIINHSFYVGNVAVYTQLHKEGFRCVYPTKKLANGQNLNLFYPIDKNLAQEIQKQISNAASELLKNQRGRYHNDTP